MNNLIVRASSLLVGALIATSAVASAAFPGDKLAPQAKVGIERARAIVLKLVGGKIVKEELEKEVGGSGLRYTFVIKSATKGLREVGVDAKSGAILENIPEKPGV